MIPRVATRGSGESYFDIEYACECGGLSLIVKCWSPGVVVPASREAALHLRAKIQTKTAARNVRDTPDTHRNINDKLSTFEYDRTDKRSPQRRHSCAARACCCQEARSPQQPSRKAAQRPYDSLYSLLLVPRTAQEYIKSFLHSRFLELPVVFQSLLRLPRYNILVCGDFAVNYGI